MSGEATQAFDRGIREIFESLFAEKHFCLPGQIVSFDKAAHTANVQPALKQLFVNETVSHLLPIIEDAPVWFPGGGGFFLTYDILPGHNVLLLIAERSIENWANTGLISDPESTRKCDLSDAICLAGIMPGPTASTVTIDSAAIALQNLAGTSKVLVKDATIEVTSGLGSISINATTGQVDINGNLTVDV